MYLLVVPHQNKIQTMSSYSCSCLIILFLLSGWHRRLNFRSSGPPPFYSLIDLLHKEANRLPIRIRLVSEKRLKKRQNKHYLSVQRKIFDLWCKYEEQTISTSRLLKDLSGVYIPSGL